ncbi:C2 calcium-dependent domain-containing protein 4A-like [Denticeps clupeoides]|uniref:C2 calcium-dependent domain-containing protein 4A-like n=1 Tax=Denticeps clupeoides TaxID=299321 RepID=UPI0010A3D556|nr:C2 calcium-dependent domain-containing protein 4A-like [Denticeps clupeoides]
MFALRGATKPDGGLAARLVTRQPPLTPERIPNFTIPPRLRLLRSPGARSSAGDLSALLSPGLRAARPGALRLPSPGASPRRLRFRLGAGRKRAGQDQWDPSAQPMEHVERITTPYGFQALAESPHVGRRESLLLKDRAPSAASRAPAPRPRLLRRSSRSLSCDDETLAHILEAAGPGGPSLTPDPVPVPRPSRRGLKVLLDKPLATLRSLTPGRRRKEASRPAGSPDPTL